MNNFEALGLSGQTIRSLEEMGFENPTEIQEKCIPLLLSGQKDLVALAQTGTGKTASFGLPLLEMIDAKQKSVQALILSPTRELGQQIADQIQKFGKYKKTLRSVAVYGGASIVPQMKDLKRGAHIVIATPGRLIDLMERRAVNLEEIRFLVLDEADEMLNMGFREDIDHILRDTPTQKSTWLFSATMPDDIRRIISEYMDENAAEVHIAPKQQVNENINHQYVVINRDNKFDSLCGFLELDSDTRGIIFSRTKLGAQKLAEQLRQANQHADALHGDLSQAQRDRVMKRFKEHELRILVATDVAARGIDVKDLNFVIHYNLPDQLEYYTHRSGRTARAGKKGVSIAFVSKTEKKKIKYLEKDLGLTFTEIEAPQPTDLMEMRVSQWCERMADVRVSDQLDEALVDMAMSAFGEFTKEDLIRKLVADIVRANAPKRSSSSSDDRGRDRDRDRDRDRGRGRDRGDDRPKREKSDSRDKKSDRKGARGDMARFFINIGKRDDIHTADLLMFICEEARIGKQDVGTITIDRNHSYFEVAKDKVKKVNAAFKDIVVDGRELRVNRDGGPGDNNDQGDQAYAKSKRKPAPRGGGFKGKKGGSSRPKR